MKPWPLVRLAGLWLLLACQTGPPDLEEALYLYREGRLNESRRDLVAYITAKPFNPESDEARQHVVLIRRIKGLEAEAVEQWRRGDLEDARRTLGVLRILHPVYADLAEISRLLEEADPERAASRTAGPADLGRIDITDSSVAARIPFALAVLDLQVEAIFVLAREWELASRQDEDDPVRRLTESLASPLHSSIMRQAQAAFADYGAPERPLDPLGAELQRLSEHFDQFLGFVRANGDQPPMKFEYGFQGYKRDLLMQILALKNRLRPEGGVPAGPSPDAPDTTEGRPDLGPGR
ncbi:MAG: hypothetical protein V3U35_08920 [Candidatus Neomarinimicrobiota bacterium]